MQFELNSSVFLNINLKFSNHYAAVFFDFRHFNMWKKLCIYYIHSFTIAIRSILSSLGLRRHENGNENYEIITLKVSNRLFMINGIFSALLFDSILLIASHSLFSVAMAPLTDFKQLLAPDYLYFFLDIWLYYTLFSPRARVCCLEFFRSIFPPASIKH
jgi:hypothetical protein